MESDKWAIDNRTFDVLYKATLERLFYGENPADIITDICENGRYPFKETLRIMDTARKNLDKFIEGMGTIGDESNHFNHPCL